MLSISMTINTRHVGTYGFKVQVMCFWVRLLCANVIQYKLHTYLMWCKKNPIIDEEKFVHENGKTVPVSMCLCVL